MSTIDAAGRSFEPITLDDLQRLRDIATANRADFFAQRPEWARLYADRLLLVALCQGAALHYLHGEAGINDFDFYSFFAAHPDRRWPDRRRAPRSAIWPIRRGQRLCYAGGRKPFVVAGPKTGLRGTTDGCFFGGSPCL